MKLFFLKLFGGNSAAISKAGQGILSLFHKAVAELEKLQAYAKELEDKHLADAQRHTDEAEALSKSRAEHAAVADKIKALVAPEATV